MLNQLIDSGVGVDSLTYSSWSKAPDAIRKCLYDCYLYLLEYPLQKSYANNLLGGRMVCIQKGKESRDTESNSIRKPGKTRPLTLSNTDMKIMSKCAAIPLDLLCQQLISSQQLGGVHGRQMVDHIVNIEAQIQKFMIENLPNAGIIALDMAAAFPSMSRRYLFWVLKRMKLPKEL